ncbi:MAG: hypothetical protein LV481_02150 [Methylacidiphilales bacterium]|nr:hypothetical protein [Candidatus Methylacidiphilales bacterium]
MNTQTTKFLIIALIFLITSVTVPATGEAGDLAWDKEIDGILLAIEWIKWTDNSREMQGIRIHLKNVSGVTRYFIEEGSDQGFHIFYDNSDGTEMQLHKDDGPSGIQTYTYTPVASPINPGQTITVIVHLHSEQEVKIVRTTPIGCSVMVSDPAAGGYKKIRTTPRMLTEISVAPF